MRGVDLREELLRQIEAAPSDPGPYLVYADWLSQQGDPHGELIALMVEEQSQARLRSSRIEHTYQHLGRILGDLARYFGRLGPTRESVDIHPHFLGDTRKGPLVSRFRYGFFERIRIGVDPHWWEESRDLESMLSRIGQSALSRFLRGLTIAAFDSYPAEIWQHNFAGLRHLRPLESLFVGDVTGPLVSALFEASAIPVHQPKLKQLALRARVVPGAAFALAELEDLRITVERFGPHAVEVMTNLQKLAHLSLALRSEWEIDRSQLALFSGGFPALRSLTISIRNPNVSVSMVAELLRGTLLDQLEKLAIVDTPLTDSDLHRLQQRFPRLQVGAP